MMCLHGLVDASGSHGGAEFGGSLLTNRLNGQTLASLVTKKKKLAGAMSAKMRSFGM